MTLEEMSEFCQEILASELDTLILFTLDHYCKGMQYELYPATSW